LKPKGNRRGSLGYLKSLLPLCGLLLLALQIVAGLGDTVERITRSDLNPLKDGMPGEEGLQREVVLAPDVKMSAVIEVTAKGNGRMRIGNLDLKVFDSHDDGSYYENGLLNIDFTDIDGDGKRELIISGIVCFTDEKGDKVLRREAVVFIYALQPNQTFKEVYRNTNFRLD